MREDAKTLKLVERLRRKTIESLEKTEVEKKVGRNLENFLNAFRNPNILAEDFEAHLRNSYQLCEALLSKFSISDNQKIILIPDGILSYIPSGMRMIF